MSNPLGQFSRGLPRALIYTLAGAILMAVAMQLLTDRRAFLNQAQVGFGVVSGLKAGGWNPEITFVTTAGQRYTFRQGGLAFGFKLEQEVRVVYLPQRPASSAMLRDPAALWGQPALVGLLGLGFGASGMLRLMQRRRRWPPA